MVNRIMKILDYAELHIDDIVSAGEFNITIKVDDNVYVEISNYFGDSHSVGFSINPSLDFVGKGVYQNIDFDPTNYKLLQYKMAKLHNLFLEHRLEQVMNKIESFERKLITNLDNIYDD